MKTLKRIVVLVFIVALVYGAVNDTDFFERQSWDIEALIGDLKEHITLPMQQETLIQQMTSLEEVDSKETLYEVLNKAAGEIEETIYLERSESYSMEDFKRDLEEWSYAYVEYVNYTYQAKKGENPQFIEIALSYYTGGHVYKKLVLGQDIELNEKEQELYELVKVILSECVDSESDYQTELNIHDWIINHSSYSKAAPEEGQDAYYLLSAEGAGVCNAYADAMHLLLNSAGIECKKVVGTSRGESHTWNQVKIDGEWYEVDVTWDDPVSSTGKETLTYNYFNLTTEEMEADHQRDSNIFYENCTATGANYYEKENIERVSTVDEAEKVLLGQLNEILGDRVGENITVNLETQLSFDITNDELYDLQKNIQRQIGNRGRRGYSINLKADGTKQLMVTIVFN